MKDTSRTYLLIGLVVFCGLVLTGLGIGAVVWVIRHPGRGLHVATRSDLVVPAKANSYTQRQFRADLLDFIRRTMVKPYETVGVRSPAWDAEARKYLEANARDFSAQPDAPSLEERIARGKALVARGCTDPMVLYCYGVALQETGETGPAEAALTRAVEGFKKHAYPRTRAFFAPRRLMELCLDAGRIDEADRWFTLTMSWIEQAGGEVQDRGKDARCFLSHISSSWDSLCAYSPDGISKALQANPKTPAYVADVVEGWYEVDEALKARGGGWAKDVKEAQWQAFDVHLKAANTVLTRAWHRHPDFPEAPTSMIVVTRGLGRAMDKSEEKRWFTRAVSAQWDYTSAYGNIALSLRPRWGGRLEELEAFGRACLDTGRFDTDVPWQYVEALYTVRNDSSYELGLDRPEAYQGLTRMCDGYIKAAETEEQRNYYRTMLANVAWTTHHYGDARAAFEAAGEKAQPAVFAKWSFGTGMTEARGQSYALTGPAADIVRKADAQREADGRKARALYRAALEKEKNPYAMAYLRYRIAELDRREMCARGEWVTLVTPADLMGWEQLAGTWTFEPDGALCGVSDERGFYLLNQDRHSPNLELEGEIEYARVPCRNAGRLSFLLNVTTHNEQYDATRAIISPTDGKVTLVRWSVGNPVAAEPAVMGKRVKFRLESRDGTLAVYLDGRLVQSATRVLPPNYPTNGGIGLRSDYSHPGVVCRFRNLRVRQLPLEP